MNSVTLIGYWRSSSEPGWPDPRDFVDNAWDDRERDTVAHYLEDGGGVPWDWMGYSRCRFCGCQNGYKELTDWTYLWPEGLSHYVREHAVRLPNQVVDHILERERLTDREVDPHWWRSATPDWGT